MVISLYYPKLGADILNLTYRIAIERSQAVSILNKKKL